MKTQRKKQMKNEKDLGNIKFKNLQINDFVEEITNEVIHRSKVFADDQNHDRIHRAVEEVIRSYRILLNAAGVVELTKNK